MIRLRNITENFPVSRLFTFAQRNRSLVGRPQKHSWSHLSTFSESSCRAHVDSSSDLSWTRHFQLADHGSSKQQPASSWRGAAVGKASHMGQATQERSSENECHKRGSSSSSSQSKVVGYGCNQSRSDGSMRFAGTG